MRVGINATKFGQTRFYLNSEVFAAVVEVVAKAPLYFGSLWLLSNHILKAHYLLLARH